MVRGRSLAMTVLAVYLILVGLMQVLTIVIPYGSLLAGGLAIAAGVLILMGR